MRHCSSQHSDTPLHQPNRAWNKPLPPARSPLLQGSHHGHTRGEGGGGASSLPCSEITEGWTQDTS